MRHLLTDLRGNPIYSFAQRRLRRIRTPSNAAALLCLVQNRAWDDVIRRVRRYANEALYQEESTGNTALHAACRLDPPPAVIRALKAASRLKNNEGATPLHIAASHRCSAESLAALIECASQQKPVGADVKDGATASPTADLSRMGRSPIHYACMSFRGLDLQAFQLLFERTLQDGNVIIETEKHFNLDDFADDELSEDGSTCQAVDAVSPREVNVLGLKDATGQTPLALLFRRYRERVKLVICKVDRLQRLHQDSPQKAALAAAMTVHADLGGLWERAGWMVARLTEERLKREGLWNNDDHQNGNQSPGEIAIAREAATWSMERLRAHPVDFVVMKQTFSSIPDDDTCKTVKCHKRRFRILHASVGLTGYGCPPEMVRLAISLHPNQVRELDEDGNLPIHIAVTASSYIARAEDASPDTVAAVAAAVADVADDLSVLSDTMSFFSSATVSQTTNPFDKVIKLLLQHYPESARVPHGRTGKLPLISAIEFGHRTWDDGIRTLLHAYPPALHSKKIIRPALYPQVLALVHNGYHENTPLDELLRPIPRSARRRHESGVRTTLFELLRTKPDWLSE